LVKRKRKKKKFESWRDIIKQHPEKENRRSGNKQKMKIAPMVAQSSLYSSA